MKYAAAAILVVVLSGSQAEARMYQWVNPETGSIQLSGSPPGWYRSTSAGPRVFVFDNGRLVDDTAVAVPEVQRERLRAAAFIGEEPEARGASANEVEDLTQALEHAADKGVDVSAVTEAFAARRDATLKDDAEPDPIADTVAQLKALLDAWDRTRLDEARSLLERAGAVVESGAGATR